MAAAMDGFVPPGARPAPLKHVLVHKGGVPPGQGIQNNTGKPMVSADRNAKKLSSFNKFEPGSHDFSDGQVYSTQFNAKAVSSYAHHAAMQQVQQRKVRSVLRSNVNGQNAAAKAKAYAEDDLSRRVQVSSHEASTSSK